ncbi:secretory calcium-binding phosphoprotein 9 [Pungitius pungitius]|uniref:secretory calcium-binding phosphoprotein 9 n=1 Tax=Pungitius pungitius TaxID=134920 RepID=UPI002E112CEC
MLAAMNAMNGGMMGGMNGGMNPGMMGGMMGGMNAGMNGGMNPGMMGGLMGGMNGVLANRVNPGMVAGGLNPPMVAAGGAGFIGQPQFAGFVPAPNVYAVPAVNGFPFMGVPQMAQVNPPQQPLMGNTGGVTQQQLPFQPDPLGRFRRQVMKQDTLKTTVETQIPSPSETTTTTPCDKDYQHEDY